MPLRSGVAAWTLRKAVRRTAQANPLEESRRTCLLSPHFARVQPASATGSIALESRPLSRGSVRGGTHPAPLHAPA